MTVPRPDREWTLASRADMGAPIRNVMQAVSVELRRLGHAGVFLQATQGPPQRGDYESPQTLDLLTQSLFELAEFLNKLGPAVDPAFEAELTEALATIRLSDMAHRLAAASGGDDGPLAGRRMAIPADLPETGVMDLF